ncbi:MAG TPA: hypothetical protein VNO30_23415, partial [Kofleriaceae bacterium]|nr:hypothetical protein [Kofleriaceae bacterium]
KSDGKTGGKSDGKTGGKSDGKTGGKTGGADEPPLPEGLGGSKGGSKSGGKGGGTDEPPLPEGLSGSKSGGKGGGTDEPPLPEGLSGAEKGGTDEPPQPEGTGGELSAGEPALPEGLGGTGGDTDPEQKQPEDDKDGKDDKDDQDDEDDEGSLFPKITGFGEFRGGARVLEDVNQESSTLNEGRLHLETEFVISKITMKAAADLTYGSDDDPVEAREASIAFSPLAFLDIKAGRQILSWGTSTSLFINDLFPKDFYAFLLGRSTEQFKAPSDAVKLSIFSDVVNFDAVYVVRFNSDRFLTGDRLSFFNPLMGKVTGQDAILKATVPDRSFEDDEAHFRLSKNLRGGELAAYGYNGFWKSPAGLDPMTMQFTFPRLRVYGGSFRDQLGLGIGHIEGGYYESLDDPKGDDPFVNNSEYRFLIGYERQAPKIARDLTLGFEYYVELMAHHDLYKSTLPPGFPARKEYRHVVVLQMIKLLYKQNITLQLYAYVSPSDRDTYVRSTLDFRLDDHFTLTAGTNLFTGVDDNTFYGQLESNSNVYVALRYGF